MVLQAEISKRLKSIKVDNNGKIWMLREVETLAFHVSQSSKISLGKKLKAMLLITTKKGCWCWGIFDSLGFT
jgi:hypothetical protein